MSPLSPQAFVDKYFTVGTVFRFDGSDLDGFTSSVPHYFVVMAKSNSEGILAVSTTQLNRKISYFEKTNRDMDTLVYIENTKENGLTKDSYFDCNENFEITREKLIRKRERGDLKNKGKLTYEEYDKIRHQIKRSKLVPEKIKSMLIHPEDPEE